VERLLLILEREVPSLVVRQRFLAWGAAVAPLVVPVEAGAASRGVGVELSAEVRDTYYTTMPTFTLSDPTETPLRTARPGTLPSIGPEDFVGGGVDCALVSNDRLLWPIIGLTVAGAVGQSPRVVTSLDGTMVEMHPWTAVNITVLLPGFGVRAKERRWMFAALARPIVTATTMAYTLANGATSVDPDARASAATIGLRADLEVCRRLDPATRACLFVSPNLYEYRWLDGGSVGLRWEAGP
jgi:hypothetical protein